MGLMGESGTVFFFSPIARPAQQNEQLTSHRQTSHQINMSAEHLKLADLRRLSASKGSFLLPSKKSKTSTRPISLSSHSIPTSPSIFLTP